MVEAADVLVSNERVSRRTDDITYNVYYLAAHCIDRERGIFSPAAERDVREQEFTDVAEADIHKLAPVVHQELDYEYGQYVRLNTGTVDNAITGLLSLDMEDPSNHFEFFRRVEEITEER